MSKLSCLFGHHKSTWVVEDLGFNSVHRFCPVNRCSVCKEVLNRYSGYTLRQDAQEMVDWLRSF